jgi:hypothetical protein
MTADSVKTTVPFLARYADPLHTPDTDRNSVVRYDEVRQLSEVLSDGEWSDRIDQEGDADADGTRITEVKKETTDDA